MVISDEQLAGFQEVAIAFLDLVRTLRTEAEPLESVVPQWVTIEAALGYANGRFKDPRRLKATVDRIYDDPQFVTGAIAGKHCDRGSRGTKGRHYYQILVPTFFEVL